MLFEQTINLQKGFHSSTPVLVPCLSRNLDHDQLNNKEENKLTTKCLLQTTKYSITYKTR